MIFKFKEFLKKHQTHKKVEDPIKISKEFNIDEFNKWFKNDFDGYDGRKGAAGIFLRTDKLSPNWIETYLNIIGQDTSYENVQKYYSIVRKNWIDQY